MIRINANDTVPRGSRREELSGAAGFFDGEGCFSYAVKGRYACVTIMQVDRRVLDRFLNAVGVGKVFGPYASKNPDPYFETAEVPIQGSPSRGCPGDRGTAVVPTRTSQAAAATRVCVSHNDAAQGHVLVQPRGCPRCVAAAWEEKRRGRIGGLIVNEEADDC
jgi:hypothetical protein